MKCMLQVIKITADPNKNNKFLSVDIDYSWKMVLQESPNNIGNRNLTSCAQAEM